MSGVCAFLSGWKMPIATHGTPFGCRAIIRASQPSRFLPSLWASAQTPRSSALSKRAADRPTYPARLLVARTIGEPMRIERAVRAAIREIDPAGSNGKDRPLAAGRPPDSVRCLTRTGARRRRSPRWPTKGRVPSANAAGFSRAADGRLRGARHLWRHLLHGRPAHARDGNPNGVGSGAWRHPEDGP